MGQPGMRVTVDAAMRARDVSRPGIDPDPGDVPAGPANGRRSASAAQNSAGADSTGGGNGSDGTRDVRGSTERDDVESRPQRDRRGKGERRRLSKRHARARR
jgi:hypothetical protein